MSLVPKKVSLQLSLKHSVGDVWIAQLDRYRVLQTRSSSCRSSVAIAAVCSLYHASLDVSWPQRASSAVRHEAAVICQVDRCLPIQRLANQACYLQIDTHYVFISVKELTVFDVVVLCTADEVNEFNRHSAKHGSSPAREAESRQTAVHRSQRRQRHCGVCISTSISVL